MVASALNDMYELQSKVELIDSQLRGSATDTTNNARTLRTAREKVVDAVNKRRETYTALLPLALPGEDTDQDVLQLRPWSKSEHIRDVMDILQSVLPLDEDCITSLTAEQRQEVSRFVREAQLLRRAREEVFIITQDIIHAARYALKCPRCL